MFGSTLWCAKNLMCHTHLYRVPKWQDVVQDAGTNLHNLLEAEIITIIAKELLIMESMFIQLNPKFVSLFQKLEKGNCRVGTSTASGTLYVNYIGGKDPCAPGCKT